MRARRRKKNGILPYFIIATGLGILYYFYKNTSSPASSLPSSGQDSSGPLPSPAPFPSPTNPSGDSGADSDSGYQ
jgi:hypothetical protein